jgi:hypothetical protein
MTASEFEIVFYEAMAKWAAGGKVDPDPRGEWECKQGDKWVIYCGTGFPDNLLCRWKPAKKRTVFIDGIELVAPEVDAPAKNCEFFYEDESGLVAATLFCGCPNDVITLINAKVFLTREDCQAMADAQRKQRMGGVL